MHQNELPGAARRLQLAVVDGAGEGNGIADVADAGHVHDHALEAQAEAGMTGGAVLPKIHVEIVVGGVHAQLADTVFQDLVVVLALAAAGNLADTGHQAVHSSDGLAVGVELHVEGLDILGVVGDKDGLLEYLLGEETLMLGLQVAAPGDGEVELVVVLMKQLHGLGVGDAAEVAIQNVVQAIQQTLVQKSVEEGHLLGSVLQDIGDDVLDHVLLQTHQILQIGKDNLGLDHPELGGMAGGVGVLGAEGGAEGVDVAEGHGEGFAVELTGNGQIGGLAEEVLAEIHLAVLGQGDIFQIHGGDLEHLACTLAVGAGNQGGVDVDEVTLLEELVDGVGGQGADAEYSLEGVGPGAQMGDGSQELHGVTLGLQGEVTGGGTLDLDGGGLDFKGLLGVGSQHQLAGDDQGGTNVDLADLLEIGDGIVVDHLNGGEVGAVVQHDEAKLLAGAAVAHPAADGNGLAGISGSAAEQLADADEFHSESTFLVVQSIAQIIRQIVGIYKPFSEFFLNLERTGKNPGIHRE